MSDSEILKRLVVIEKEAAQLVKEAELEAERRLTQKREEAKQALAVSCSKQNEKLEEEFLKEKQRLMDEQENRIEAYERHLADLSLNKAELFKKIEMILSEVQ